MTDKIDDFVPLKDQAEDIKAKLNEYAPTTDRTENFNPIPDKATFDLETDRYIGVSEHNNDRMPFEKPRSSDGSGTGSLVLGVLNFLIIVTLSYFIFFI